MAITHHQRDTNVSIFVLHTNTAPCRPRYKERSTLLHLKSLNVFVGFCTNEHIRKLVHHEGKNVTYRDTTARLNRGCLYTEAELNLDSTPPVNSSDRSGYLGRNSVMMQAFLLSVVWHTGMERPTMNNKVSPKQGFRLMLALL